jgi:hypothetical protein
MVTGGGYMTRPHLIISYGILECHIQLVMQILKIEIVLGCSLITMENGMIVRVAIPCRIYVKAIFVSLLFYFADNIIQM